MPRRQGCLDTCAIQFEETPPGFETTETITNVLYGLENGHILRIATLGPTASVREIPQNGILVSSL